MSSAEKRLCYLDFCFEFVEVTFLLFFVCVYRLNMSFCLVLVSFKFLCIHESGLDSFVKLLSAIIKRNFLAYLLLSRNKNKYWKINFFQSS